MKRMKAKHGLTYKCMCAESAVARSSLMRWKGREDRGEPIIEKPGPKKVEPLDLEALRSSIRALERYPRGIGRVRILYQTWRGAISRRDLRAEVAQIRREMHRERLGTMKHISWNVPGLVWAIDDTEDREAQGIEISMNNIRDLGSKYYLPPVVTEGILHGEDVAEHLDELFGRYGPPLFLKRDSGSNLRCKAVDRMLEKYFVIPLNSPTYYPQYNGGIERSHRGIKGFWEEKRSPIAQSRVVEMAALAVQAACELNHTPRRSLGEKTACSLYQQASGNLRPYNRRKRKEVYDWIRDRAFAIMESMGGGGRKEFDCAWRIATETWLRNNGVITVSTGKKCYPISRIKKSHK